MIESNHEQFATLAGLRLRRQSPNRSNETRAALKQVPPDANRKAIDLR